MATELTLPRSAVDNRVATAGRLKRPLLLPQATWLVLVSAACGPDPCPPGSTRADDGLCYLDGHGTQDDSGEPSGDTDDTDDTDDTGDLGQDWAVVEGSCDAVGTSYGDPLVEVGSYFVQDDLFAEGTDLELDGDVAWTAGQGGVWSVDISDPTAPAFLGMPDEEGPGSRWYNVLPGPGDALYVSNRERGFGVLDRSDPSRPVMLEETIFPGPAGMARTDDRLYVASLQGTLLTYDISEPLEPVLLDEMSGLSNAWAVKLSGTRAYVSDNTDGLVVVDLSEPDLPAVVGAFETAGGGQDLDIAEDGSAVYVATGGSGIEVFSLADPDVPESLGAISVSYSVLSVAVGGDTLWAVNHQDVVALDIGVPLDPVLLNTQQTEQWSMHVAADAERAWVADWGYLTSFEVNAGVAAPDADFSSGQVFLPTEGGGTTLKLTNLGSAPLELLGATAGDERVVVQAEATTVAPGTSVGLRVSWEGGEDLETTLCLATDDPDEGQVEIDVVGAQDGNPALGTDAPDFSLTGLDGETYTLSEHLGRPVFIAFFATW